MRSGWKGGKQERAKLKKREEEKERDGKKGDRKRRGERERQMEGKERKWIKGEEHKEGGERIGDIVEGTGNEERERYQSEIGRGEKEERSYKRETEGTGRQKTGNRGRQAEERR
jgi:hypothetical protein